MENVSSMRPEQNSSNFTMYEDISDADSDKTIILDVSNTKKSTNNEMSNDIPRESSEGERRKSKENSLHKYNSKYVHRSRSDDSLEEKRCGKKKQISNDGDRRHKDKRRRKGGQFKNGNSKPKQISKEKLKDYDSCEQKHSNKNLVIKNGNVSLRDKNCDRIRRHSKSGDCGPIIEHDGKDKHKRRKISYEEKDHNKVHMKNDHKKYEITKDISKLSEAVLKSSSPHRHHKTSPKRHSSNVNKRKIKEELLFGTPPSSPEVNWNEDLDESKMIHNVYSCITKSMPETKLTSNLSSKDSELINSDIDIEILPHSDCLSTNTTMSELPVILHTKLKEEKLIGNGNLVMDESEFIDLTNETIEESDGFSNHAILNFMEETLHYSTLGTESSTADYKFKHEYETADISQPLLENKLSIVGCKIEPKVDNYYEDDNVDQKQFNSIDDLLSKIINAAASGEISSEVQMNNFIIELESGIRNKCEILTLKDACNKQKYIKDTMKMLLENSSDSNSRINSEVLEITSKRILESFWIMKIEDNTDVKDGEVIIIEDDDRKNNSQSMSDSSSVGDIHHEEFVSLNENNNPRIDTAKNVQNIDIVNTRVDSVLSNNNETHISNNSLQSPDSSQQNTAPKQDNENTSKVNNIEIGKDNLNGTGKKCQVPDSGDTLNNLLAEFLIIPNEKVTNVSSPVVESQNKEKHIPCTKLPSTTLHYKPSENNAKPLSDENVTSSNSTVDNASLTKSNNERTDALKANLQRKPPPISTSDKPDQHTGNNNETTARNTNSNANDPTMQRRKDVFFFVTNIYSACKDVQMYLAGKKYTTALSIVDPSEPLTGKMDFIKIMRRRAEIFENISKAYREDMTRFVLIPEYWKQVYTSFPTRQEVERVLSCFNEIISTRTHSTPASQIANTENSKNLNTGNHQRCSASNDNSQRQIVINNQTVQDNARLKNMQESSNAICVQRQQTNIQGSGNAICVQRQQTNIQGTSNAICVQRQQTNIQGSSNAICVQRQQTNIQNVQNVTPQHNGPSYNFQHNNNGNYVPHQQHNIQSVQNVTPNIALGQNIPSHNLQQNSNTNYTPHQQSNSQSVQNITPQQSIAPNVALRQNLLSHNLQQNSNTNYVPHQQTNVQSVQNVAPQQNIAPNVVIRQHLSSYNLQQNSNANYLPYQQINIQGVQNVAPQQNVAPNVAIRQILPSHNLQQNSNSNYSPLQQTNTGCIHSVASQQNIMRNATLQQNMPSQNINNTYISHQQTNIQNGQNIGPSHQQTNIQSGQNIAPQQNLHSQHDVANYFAHQQNSRNTQNMTFQNLQRLALSNYGQQSNNVYNQSGQNVPIQQNFVDSNYVAQQQRGLESVALQPEIHNSLGNHQNNDTSSPSTKKRKYTKNETSNARKNKSVKNNQQQINSAILDGMNQASNPGSTGQYQAIQQTCNAQYSSLRNHLLNNTYQSPGSQSTVNTGMSNYNRNVQLPPASEINRQPQTMLHSQPNNSANPPGSVDYQIQQQLTHANYNINNPAENTGNNFAYPNAYNNSNHNDVLTGTYSANLQLLKQNQTFIARNSAVNNQIAGNQSIQLAARQPPNYNQFFERYGAANNQISNNKDGANNQHINTTSGPIPTNTMNSDNATVVNSVRTKVNPPIHDINKSPLNSVQKAVQRKELDAVINKVSSNVCDSSQSGTDLPSVDDLFPISILREKGLIPHTQNISTAKQNGNEGSRCQRAQKEASTAFNIQRTNSTDVTSTGSPNCARQNSQTPDMLKNKEVEIVIKDEYDLDDIIAGDNSKQSLIELISEEEEDFITIPM